MYIKLFRDLLSFIAKYEKVGQLPIRIIKSNVSSVGPSSERNRKKFLFLSTKEEGSTLETLDFTVRIDFTVCISTLPPQHTTFILLSFMPLFY